MYPEIVKKAMIKEDRNRHLLPVKLWVLHFSPYCGHTVQGILVKPGKYPWVIFNASNKRRATQSCFEWDFTPTEFKAIIDFGKSKTRLLTTIYNWRDSYRRRSYYLVLADITACFRFPRIHTNVTEAFSFMAEDLYFLATSMSLDQTHPQVAGSLAKEQSSPWSPLLGKDGLGWEA